MKECIFCGKIIANKKPDFCDKCNPCTTCKYTDKYGMCILTEVELNSPLCIFWTTYEDLERAEHVPDGMFVHNAT